MTALKQRRGISQRRQRRAGRLRSQSRSRNRVSARTGTTSRQTPQWQVLEEAVAGTTTQRYVWSPVYVDALILRDRDTDANGSLDERLWVMQDANWNVVGLVNASGVVVERYAYDAFGSVTVMNGSWTVIGSSAYGWVHGHQGLRLDIAGYYNRERIYDPVMGRFRTMDPIRYESETTNLYGYVSNQPLNRLDPSGLKAISIALVEDTKGFKAEIDALNTIDTGFIPILFRRSDDKSIADTIKKIVASIRKVVDDKKDCIAVVDFSGHADPTSIQGFSAQDIHDLFSAIKDLFCKPCSIYFSGCNTGLKGGAIPQTAANATGCTAYGTAGYCSGSKPFGNTIVSRKGGGNPWGDYWYGRGAPFEGSRCAEGDKAYNAFSPDDKIDLKHLRPISNHKYEK